MGALLSDELQGKYEKRGFPLRKGDTVKVMRGDDKGTTGKVRTIDLKRGKITVEGVVVARSDLSEVP
ncbi:large subunit ribosomal protein L24 [Candidatus Methanophagaceae archaeon]|nr:large subunit ribosomal protein L24 [Methanophagales archaeon]